MLRFIILLGFLLPTLSHAEPKYAVIKSPKGKEFHTGLRHKKKALEGLGETHLTLAECDNLPEEFDLRTLGTVPVVKNQGSCGSCWSFSKTGSLESATLASGGKMLDLSEQELVACDKTQWGCDGGLLTDFKYQIDHGQGLEKDMPYTSGSTGRNGTCKTLPVAAKGMSFAYVGAANRAPTEKELKCALYKSHTIPWITVSASNAWGSPPASEKTVYSRCGRGQTNHAVGVVGWFKGSNGKTAFIMKNSWGTSWGDKGYMSLPLGCDNFGEEVAYVITQNLPCKPPMVKLPAEVQVEMGTEAMLGVKEVEGVDYTWFKGSDQIGVGNMIYVSPSEDTIYKLVAKNSCGASESSVRVKMISL